jgi:FtsP/CotA-like multicopper oxidase with cupredoxin domain
VALDQPILYNRLGASNVNGMMFAMERDVINKTSGLTLNNGGAKQAGNVAPRPDKRPRPLVLRVREGDCVAITLTNLLAPLANPLDVMPPQFNVFIDEQVFERNVSFHPSGMQYLNGPQDDGAFVGENTVNSSVAVGNSTTYNLYAAHEGVYMARDMAAILGSDGLQGNSSNGLFGQVIVEPKGARIYRSLLTEEEMRLVSMDLDPASPTCGARNLTLTGQPIVDYEARYPVANCDGV